MTKIAVIGSRTFSNLSAVRQFVQALPRDSIVLSGGAIGVDQAAEDAARACRLSRWIFEPMAAHDASRSEYIEALFKRNRAIVEECDRVVAFWDGSSNGTGRVIAYAKELGRPVEIRKVQ